MHAPPAIARVSRGNERGVALVMAILVLLVIVMLASLVMQNLSTERKISGHGMRSSRALDVANAGVAEAASRLRSGEIALDETRSASAAQIFLAGAGSLPAAVTDTVMLATAQPASARLAYSTATRGPDALTLGFKRDPASGAIVRYDDSQTPALNTLTGLAVVQVSCTGTTGTDRARVLAEIVPKPQHPILSGAITSAVGVSLAGTAAVCGYRHSGATAFGHGINGRVGTSPCTGDEIGRGDVPAVWTLGTVNNSGMQLAGSPAATLTGQSSFYDGPWEASGMSQAAFTTLLGTPTATPTSYAGAVWMDNNSTLGDRGANYTINNLAGSGVLYVDGDLTLTGTTAYRGLVYVEGNLSASGSGSIIGGLVVRGRAGGSCSLNGVSVLYSLDAVTAGLARAAHANTTLAWREFH